MIVIQENNSNEMDRNGFFICQETTPLIVQEVPEVEGCDTSKCEYFEYAFKGSNDETNDKASILLTLSKEPTFREYKLCKGSQEYDIDISIAEISNRGTLSVEDKEGIVIDWGKVYDLYGGGDYYISLKYTVLGVNYEVLSHKYKVVPYSYDIAKNTFRIEFVKDCYFEDGRDYRGLNWSECHRIRGYFGNKKANLEIDSYINCNRVDEIIQRDLYFDYEANLFIPLSVQNNILEGTAFDSYVTTYSIDTEKYSKLQVIFESVDIEEYYRNKNRLFTVKVRDKKRNNIKRFGK
jgi:hypothetical protein